MLSIIGIAIVLLAIVITPRMRVPRAASADHLGCMSQRWLAEQRASHSP